MTNTITINSQKFSFKLVEGKPMIDSMSVAEHFEKRHADFIRKIESDVAFKDFLNERKIALVEYKDAKGEMRKAYLLDRDAFSYYVMSFTGEKASQWKLAYIKAFNEMEKELLVRNQPMSIEDMIIAQATSVKELKSKVEAVSTKVEAIEAKQKEAEKALTAIEPANTPSPDKPLRGRINEIVRMYCQTNAVPYDKAWKKLYQEVYYRLHTDLKRRAKNGKSRLDVADELGILPDIYAIASEIFIKKAA